MTDFFPFERYRLYQINKEDDHNISSALISIYLNENSKQEKSKEFIDKIITAIKINPNECQYTNSLDDINTAYLFIFDDEVAQDSNELYQLEASDSRKQMIAHSALTIAKDQSLKRRLWETLKTEFLS